MDWEEMRDKLCHVRLAILWLSLAQLIAQISKLEAVLSPDEENVLKILQETVFLPNWTGDPCNETWITCSNRDPQTVLELHLAGKSLTGALPSDISELRNISFINFRGNQLNGSIPDISNLTKLTKLWLASNKFSGGIPESLFRKGALVEIDLHGNKLNGTVPKALENMTQAKYLNIRSNMLEGLLPNLSALVQLEQFDASNNGLTGPFPDIPSSELFALSIASNFLTGTVPASIYQNSKLLWIFMSNNSLDPAPMFDMSQLTGLLALSAGSCNFQGPIPSLENNQALDTLYLPGNNLTSIATDLRNLSSLTTLNVANNRIGGNLPLLPDASTQSSNKVLKNIDFSNNSFAGEIPKSWIGLSFLEEMNLAYNSLQELVPNGIGRLSLLKTLNLSNNNLSGPIPDEFSFLTNLQILDLRNNQLTGAVPEKLVNLSNLQSLFLDNNSFSCIPKALAKDDGRNFTLSGMEGPYCDSHQGGLSRGGIIGVAVGAICAFGAILAITLLLIGTKRKRHFNQLSKEDMPKSAKAFNFREIKSMTENFKQSIGRGGFGVVYYGKLPSGKEVAVKVRATDSNQGAKEFLNEVQLLSRLHHRNLVPLIGYCLDGQQQILVYEYTSQGTLHDHLHNLSTDSGSSGKGPSSSQKAMDWKTRLNILLNAARGLEYLHKDCKPPVIHRDVKSSNILLTEKLEAKFSDLGISKQAYEPDADETLNSTGISTAVQGTWGYLDPEYFTRRKLTAKSDVYSFGVILLEVVTGKRAQSQKFPDSQAVSLKAWVEEAFKQNAVRSVIDPTLEDDYTEEGMVMVVEAVLSCLLPDGVGRPNMGDIVLTLLEVIQIEKNLSKSPEVPEEITVSSSGQLSDPIKLEGTQLSLVSSNSNVDSNTGWRMSPR